MRPIDADKLKRRVQKLATEAWKMSLRTNVETTLNQFIDFINEAPTVNQVPLWIPCRDILPDENEWVLCSCKDGLLTVMKLKSGSWYKSETAQFRSSYVNAWMKLPEAYEE